MKSGDTNPTLEQAARTLVDQLKLHHQPIAIAFREKAPKGMNRVSIAAPAGCSYWKLASEGQSFYTEAFDHYHCPIGSHTHGIDLPDETAKELEGLVQTMVGIQYIRKEDIAAIPRLQKPFHVALYAPLGAASFEPDVILVRGSVQHAARGGSPSRRGDEHNQRHGSSHLRRRARSHSIRRSYYQPWLHRESRVYRSWR